MSPGAEPAIDHPISGPRVVLDADQDRGSAPRGKLSLREMQREMTRTRIIDAALVVFETKGFAAATMEDVAAEAFLSRPTIYSHFENKAGILRAAMAQLPKIKPVLVSILDAETRAERRAGFEAMYSWWLTHLYRVYPYVHAAAAVDDEIDEWARGFVRHPMEMLTEKLVAQGIGRTVAEPRAFMVVCLWAEAGFRVGGMGRHLDAAASVDALTDLYEAVLALPPQ